MRIVLLLPLALAVAAGGCRTASQGTEQAAFRVPERDLTLRESGAPDVQVASPAELASTPTQRATMHQPRRARRPAPAPRSAAPAPALVPTPAEPVPLATSAAPEAPDPHALAPGQSVTIIPASSSGPSTDPDWTDQRPSGPTRGITVGSGGHGGGCHPRGGGMGPSARGGAFRDLR
jgi:hypothetical protein